MALENESTGFVMPVAPSGNGYGMPCGNSGFFGGNFDSLIVLFLFAAMFGGFGNNGFGGNGNGAYPWMLASNTDNNVQAGFNQMATAGQLSAIQSSLDAAEVAACNRAMSAMQTAYGNQIAELERSFAAQTANTAGLTNLSAQLAQCCCENRQATNDLKYTIANEACTNRSALASSTQRILDQMCADKIDAKNEKIADLERQLTMANLAASQTAQTAKILADNAAQTVALEQYLAPVPRPAWIVQNPNCCSANAGCGCGSF
ncbi:MAG: hypothetical protein J5958_06605 [Clostridia bacterium]|nr:hypothetical protein [Clostridia bacterium]